MCIRDRVCRALRRAHAPSRLLCWLWLAVGLRFVLPWGIPLKLPRPESAPLAAAADTHAEQVVLAGGVAANGRLRQLVNDGAQKLGARVYLPELKYCGDNGAMIAAQGYYELRDGNTADWDLNGLPTLPIDYR